MSTFFAAANPWSPGTYNPGQGIAADVNAGGLGQVAISASTKPSSPAHPFFWFVVIAGLTAGFIGTSTSLRLGRRDLKVSAN